MTKYRLATEKDLESNVLLSDKDIEDAKANNIWGELITTLPNELYPYICRRKSDGTPLGWKYAWVAVEGEVQYREPTIEDCGKVIEICMRDTWFEATLMTIVDHQLRFVVKDVKLSPISVLNTVRGVKNARIKLEQPKPSPYRIPTKDDVGKIVEILRCPGGVKEWEEAKLIGILDFERPFAVLWDGIALCILEARIKKES